MAAALGKRPPLTLDECRDLANLIGMPDFTPDDSSFARDARIAELERDSMRRETTALLQAQDWRARAAALEAALRDAYLLCDRLISYHAPKTDGIREALIETRARAFVALSCSTPQGGWRTIKSAPDDGTPLWLYENDLSYEGWWEADGGYWYCPCVSEANPTHWQPLPAAPKQEG